MKFKAGDRVRFTREAIKKHLENDWEVKDDLLFGAVVVESADRTTIVKNKLQYISSTRYFELVPEEPEFEFGEEIEVWNPLSDRWDKRIFISKIPGKVGCAYACVYKREEDSFKNGKTFEVQLYKSARKLKPQLTRKEIAEKFGMSEDFTLVD